MYTVGFAEASVSWLQHTEWAEGSDWWPGMEKYLAYDSSAHMRQLHSINLLFPLVKIDLFIYSQFTYRS